MKHTIQAINLVTAALVTFKDGTYYTKKIYLIVMKSPTELVSNGKMDKSDASWIYRALMPTSENINGLTRHGHNFPHNKGVIEVSFSSEVAIKLKGILESINDVRNTTLSDLSIDGVNANEFVFKHGKFKIIADHTKNVLDPTTLPDYVIDFMKGYVAVGGWASSSKWKKVMSWYQGLEKKLPIPGVVFRGIETDNDNMKVLQQGDSIDYVHHAKYPVSTSTSRVVATDYSSIPFVRNVVKRAKDPSLYGYENTVHLLLELHIQPSDVVIDTRLVKGLSDHPSQNEIVLRPDKSYKANVVDRESLK